MFTKRHYKAIAGIIHECSLDRLADGRKDQSVISKRQLIHRLMSFFEADNGLFNRKKFIAACKGE